MTFASFEGADGRSLIVLVSICNEEGKSRQRSRRRLTLPVCLRTDKNALPVAGTSSHQTRKPSLSSNFMLTLDASPYYNSKAVAMSISQNMKKVASAPKNVDDLKTYDDYEFLYRKAAEETKEEMKKPTSHGRTMKTGSLPVSLPSPSSSATWASAKKKLSSISAATTGDM